MQRHPAAGVSLSHCYAVHSSTHELWVPHDVDWQVGGTLLATSAQTSPVDERPLTSDWFPIERLMDSPVLHVSAFTKEVVGTEDDSEDERGLT